MDRLANEGADGNARDLPTAMPWVNKHKMSRALTALLLAVGDIPPVEPGRMPGYYEHNIPDVEIMRLLLKRGAVPNAVDESHNSPLSLA